MTRSLLIHSGAVGDFILALRVIAVLQQHGDEAVTVLGRGYYAQIAEMTDIIDRVLDMEVGAFYTLFGELPDLPAEVAEALSPFDVAVDMLGGADPRVATKLRRAGIRNVIGIDPRPRDDWDGHITDQWLADLRAAGIDGPPQPPRLRVSTEQHDAGASDLDRLAGADRNRTAVLHPGSGSKAKCWPLENHLELARALRARNWHVVFLVGPTEMEWFSTPEMDRLDRSAPIYRNEDLRNVASILGAADLFVGQDSGMSHLAAALGARTRAIFGPTEPAKWRPIGPHVTVLHRPPGWPSVDQVLETID